MPPPKPLADEDLVLHILNVGFGDNIVVELPADDQGLRRHGIVDCRRGPDTAAYLDRLAELRPAHKRLAFVCATHPHSDHISGIRHLIVDPDRCPLEFWDSGFRHRSATYVKILLALRDAQVQVYRASAGMERYLGTVQITVLSPSVFLRNRYATYGIDMNNASIVLRLENHKRDTLLIQSDEYTGSESLEAKRKAGRAVAILAGDAEFDSWSRIRQDFARAERTSEHRPLVRHVVNALACAVVKVAHHGSMHSAPLDVYEQMHPKLAVISTEQEMGRRTIGERLHERPLFPHTTTVAALQECETQILTTDGSYEAGPNSSGTPIDPDHAHPGSVVVAIPPGGPARWIKLDDRSNEIPIPPTEI